MRAIPSEYILSVIYDLNRKLGSLLMVMDTFAKGDIIHIPTCLVENEAYNILKLMERDDKEGIREILETIANVIMHSNVGDEFAKWWKTKDLDTILDELEKVRQSEDII